MSNGPQRRDRIDQFTAAETAIWNAVQVVEAAGADVRLTRAINKLAEARALVADFVDGVPDGEGYPRAMAGMTSGTIEPAPIPPRDLPQVAVRFAGEQGHEFISLERFAQYFMTGMGPLCVAKAAT